MLGILEDVESMTTELDQEMLLDLAYVDKIRDEQLAELSENMGDMGNSDHVADISKVIAPESIELETIWPSEK
jgi:hypothetical protein